MIISTTWKEKGSGRTAIVLINAPFITSLNQINEKARLIGKVAKRASGFLWLGIHFCHFAK